MVAKMLKNTILEKVTAIFNKTLDSFLRSFE